LKVTDVKIEVEGEDGAKETILPNTTDKEIAATK